LRKYYWERDVMEMWRWREKKRKSRRAKASVGGIIIKRRMVV
jgi:hypothetical protein